MTCDVCGAEIQADDTEPAPEDRSICEECARARNFDELLWEADAQDGALDGEIG
jgi:hypothetical protein